MATQVTDIGELEITDELIAERRAEKPGETPEDMTHGSDLSPLLLMCSIYGWGASFAWPFSLWWP